MKKLLTTVVIAFFLTLPIRGQAAQPTAEPMLRIETGMHTAAIMKIGIDAANRFLVTGSRDKTVRVWELHRHPGEQAQARPVRVIRPPVGEGDEGKIYAVAISPDGKTIACGGWTKLGSDAGHTIYLFDRASGAMVKRITGLPNRLCQLAFSKNSRFLVAALGGNGIRVFRTSDDSLAGQDQDYSAAIYGADFDNSGRLVTASWDGFVRLYNRSFHLLKKTKSPGGIRPYSVSFSPDGSMIAVGFADSSKVDVLSGKDLSWLFSPDVTGFSKEIGNVSWSWNGRYLYGGGRNQQ